MPKKIVYSFNTLTAQATIHPNLGLDLENDSYDVDNCNMNGIYFLQCKGQDLQIVLIQVFNIYNQLY